MDIVLKKIKTLKITRIASNYTEIILKKNETFKMMRIMWKQFIKEWKNCWKVQVKLLDFYVRIPKTKGS